MEADNTLRLIAYLEGDLALNDRKALLEELKENPALRLELEKLEELYATMEADRDLSVPKELRSDFNKILSEEKSRHFRSTTLMAWVYRSAAAVALIAVGVWLGISIDNNKTEQDQQLAELQKEVKANRELILQSLQQPTASQRFIGVSASNTINTPDDEVVDALIRVMNEDDNTNVRLAAVRALSRFADNERIRKALIDAVVVQSDPLVQVALIDILVELDEKRIVPTLERLIKADTTMETVRDEAEWGVMKLS